MPRAMNSVAMPASTDLYFAQQLDLLHRSFVADAGPAAADSPYSAAIIRPSGEGVAQVASAPLFADVLGGVARHAGRRYPGSTWRADHILVSNSPFLGGLALDTVIVL